MIKVGIIGANGYLGIELIRILSMHPNVKLSKIFQRELPIDEEFPHLQSLLAELTDDYVEFHLDLEKHKDMAPDNSHAGAKSHKKLANMIMNKLS